MTPEQIAKWNAELRESLAARNRPLGHRPGRMAAPSFPRISVRTKPSFCTSPRRCSRTSRCFGWTTATIGPRPTGTPRSCEQLLRLNIKPYLPRMTAGASRCAFMGRFQRTDDEAGLKEFSAVMKLEPFQRGMRELAPTVWITALRKVQNPNRAGLDIVSGTTNFGTLKVSPVFYWSDADMEAYLAQAPPARMSGITSIPPRPMTNASAACTPPGAERPSRGLATSTPDIRVRTPRPNVQLPSRPSSVPRNRGHPRHARSRGGVRTARRCCSPAARIPSACCASRKRPFARPTFRCRFLNVDTGHHFPELNEFRDRRAKELGGKADRSHGR